PNINDVFSEVHREESHRNVMIGKKAIDPVESSTLVIEKIAMKASDQSNKTHDKLRVWCDHYNKPRHM
uniref:hypothetical protein n=1 Tax=Picosynechococcus sp. (strain ATCC 27264 / PCC 7002 / PR-6) TaxID=32049 RepID=UPI001C3DA6C7